MSTIHNRIGSDSSRGRHSRRSNCDVASDFLSVNSGEQSSFLMSLPPSQHPSPSLSSPHSNSENSEQGWLDAHSAAHSVRSSALVSIAGSKRNVLINSNYPSRMNQSTFNESIAEMRSEADYIDLKEFAFRPNPSHIVFEEFEPFQVYRKTIGFRNNDRLTRNIRVEIHGPRQFKLEGPYFNRTPSQRIHVGKVARAASGIEVLYDVIFSPEEEVDYRSMLWVISDDQEYSIPIASTGPRAELDFPESLDFAHAPVRYTSEKVFFVQNSGKIPASFILQTDDPFSVSPTEGQLSPGEGLQIVVSFCPEIAQVYDGLLIAQFSNGDTQMVALNGTGQNANIQLSEQLIQFDPIFLGHSSRKQICIRNNSDVRVRFDWTRFATSRDEHLERSRQLNTIAVSSVFTKATSGSSSSSDVFSNISNGSTGSHAVDSGIVREFRKKQSLIEADRLLFDKDEAFTIYPLSGEILPHSDAWIYIDFHPPAAEVFERVAFCNVQGRETRLPLKLTGVGRGPDVRFTFTDLEIGDIYINSLHEYELKIENLGSIPARFELVPPKSLFGTKFSFDPTTGIVDPGSSQDIAVRFKSDTIGEFSEWIRWKIENSKEELAVNVVGRVIGPSFEFDQDEIDFGSVAFGFLSSRTVTLFNTSEIPLVYSLRIPQDGKYLQREFNILPASGTILPKSSVEIKIEFLANKAQKYRYHLILDVDDVGEDCFQLPIRADCVVPEILLSATKIHFGDCFVGKSYERILDVGNKTGEPAKFEIITPSNEENRAVQVHVSNSKGVIPSRSALQIKITITTLRVGTIITPIYVNILGSQRPAMEISVAATSIGPEVGLSTDIVEWGKVRVLQDHRKKLMLHNSSPIPAEFEVSFNGRYPVFRVNTQTGTVPAESSLALDIIFHPDERMRFSDEIVIDILHGKTLKAKLVGSGKGNTLMPSTKIENMDLGSRFTELVFQETFTLHNMGRRPQAIQWANVRPRKRGEENKQVFKVSPERSTIEPQTAEVFTIEGKSVKPGTVHEQFICRTTGKNQSTLFTCNVICDFILPLIKCSKEQLTFEYMYDSDNPPTVQTEPITIRNISPLPLDFSLHISGAFSVDVLDHSLQAEESCIVNVRFDPDFARNRHSQSINQNIEIVYRNHPQKDTINVRAAINFPNLEFTSNTMDFGAVLNGMAERRVLTVRNSGIVDAEFQWFFEDSSQDDAETKQSSLSLGSALDIVPNTGIVRAGQTESIEFIYHGGMNRTLEIDAQCAVEGGPVYPLTIRGESSDVQYQLDNNVLDFGILPFDAIGLQELTIHNTGKVPFHFVIKLDSKYLQDMLIVSPMSKTVRGGSKCRISFHFLPGLPDSIDESFSLEVGDFPPETIRLRALALNPVVRLNIPRSPAAAEPLLGTISQDIHFKRVIQQLAEASEVKPRTKLTSGEEVSIELERIQLMNHLKENPLVLLRPKTSRTRPGTASVTSRTRPPSRLSTYRLTAGVGSGAGMFGTTMKSQSHAEVNAKSVHSWVTGRYVCEMGNLVRGKSYRKSFKLTNLGISPVSIQIDRKLFAAQGFSIEPAEVKRLPGFPQHESVTFELTFNSSKMDDVFEPVESFSTRLPIQIVDGPIIEVEFRASIIVPELHIKVPPHGMNPDSNTPRLAAGESKDSFDESESLRSTIAARPAPPAESQSTTGRRSYDAKLQFGRLLLGQLMVVTVELENKRAIPCEWTLEEARKPRISRSGRRSKHTCFSASHTAGVLRPGEKQLVEFSFSPETTARHTTVFQLKFAHSSRVKRIHCVGVGEEIEFSLNPDVLDIGAAQPYTSEEVSFSLVNSSDREIEVVSLDFDEQYFEEQEILLASADAFTDEHLLIPPRDAGDPLPEAIVSAYKRKVANHSAPDQEAKTGESHQGNLPQEQEQEQEEESGNQDTENVGMGVLSTTSEKHITPSPILVVHGAPLTGITRHSHQLAELAGIPSLSIDRIFELDRIRQNEKNGAEDQPEEQGVEKGDNDSSQLKSSEDRDRESTPNDSTHHHHHGSIDTCSDREPSMDHLIDICKEMLTDLEEYRDGFVIEGLNNSHGISEFDVAQAIVQGCASHPVYMLVLSADELTIRIRDLENKEKLASIKLEESRVEPLHEDEYDELSCEEKQLYEDRLRTFRSNKKKLEHISRTKQNLIAEASKPETSAYETIDLVEAIEQYQEKYEAFVSFQEEQIQQQSASKRRISKKNADELDHPVVHPPEVEYEIKPDDDDVTRRIKIFKQTLLDLEKIFNQGQLNDPPSDEAESGDKENSRAKLKSSKSVGKSLIQSPRPPAPDDSPVEQRTFRFDSRLPFEELSQMMFTAIPGLFTKEEKELEDNEQESSTIPEPYIRQKIRYPTAPAGGTTKPSQHFKILEQINVSDEQQNEVSQWTESTRWILPPRSEKVLFVRFHASEVGDYETTLRFGITGRDNEYVLPCKATCTVPEISTFIKQVFPYRVRARPPSNKFVRGKFIVSEKVFEFGPLLIRPSYDDAFKEELTASAPYRTEFQITNVSQFSEPTEISFATEDADGGAPSEVFTLSTSELTLQKDAVATVVLWAFPKKVGPLRGQVICSIKDNPTPFCFDISCIGAEPSVECSRVSVDFGKLLVTESISSQLVTIRNTATIPVTWRMANSTDLNPVFTVSPIEGVLEYGSEENLEIHFQPADPCVVEDQLILEYADVSSVTSSKQVSISISAEAFDLRGVKVEQDLDFGTVRVVDGGQRSFFLSNTGKYDIGYSFHVPPHLESYFSVKSAKGGKEGNLLVANDKKNPRTECIVSFKPMKEIVLQGNTDIKVNFLEVGTGKHLGTESLSVTATSVFSKYSIQPVHGINFGPLISGKERTKEFEITNRGAFPFQFSIGNMAADDTPQKSSSSKSKASRGSKRVSSSQRKQRTKKPTAGERIEVGPYTIEPVEGEIEPGSTVTINVTFRAEGSKLSREVLAIDIKERDPNDHKKGVPLDIVGESCIPGIAASDFDSIFEEQQIVHSLDPSTAHRECVFCVDDRVLHFGTVASGIKVEENIRITNPFKVPCSIEVSLKPRDASDTLSVDAFDVHPKNFMIPAHEHRYVTLYFAPTRLHTYSAMFTLSVIDGTDVNTKELKFELRGDGSLPQITIVKPALDENTGTRILSIPKTLVGRQAEMPIVIRNDGILDATATLDLPFHPSLTLSDSGKAMVLQSKESRQLVIYFEPQNSGLIESIVTMNVAGNEFENTKIKIVAEGFQEDVTFEDLPFDKFEELEFGDCAIGTESTRTFMMQNHSKQPIRFEWEQSIPGLTVSPTVGHLQAESSLDISVSVMNIEPRQVIRQPLGLQMTRIQYTDPNADNIWDDRHKSVQWIQVEEGSDAKDDTDESESTRKSASRAKKGKKRASSAKKKVAKPDTSSSESEPPEKVMVTKRVEVVDPEPAHDVVGDVQRKTLAVSFRADYCRYECEIKDQRIKFKSTNILGSKSHSFTLVNTGNVELRFRWRQDREGKDGSHASSQHLDKEQPFSIIPSHGAIAPGETANFVLKYAPTEVDHHIAHFKCSIPNLEPTAGDLSFTVEGRSVCPVVHFELNASDYLTSGRRNPDLPGPDGKYGALDPRTRVIEIHTTGIKTRATLRFFILNPTSTTYEFEWKRIRSNTRARQEIGVQPREGDAFFCTTRRGIVQSGKKTEIVFEYTSESIEPQESFWLFRIPDFNFEVPFLVVGFSSEPRIFLDKARINFQSVLVGRSDRRVLHICNRERTPFSFSLERSEFTANDQPNGPAVFTVVPSSGTIAPGQDLPIEVLFTPSTEENFNFQLRCHVKRKPTILSCNMKGEGFAVHERIEMESDSKHGKPITLQPSVVNAYNFGKAQVNEKRVKRLTISNTGSHNFDFQWFNPSNKFVSVRPEVGTVKRGDRVVVELIFNPIVEGILSDHKLVCKIVNGNSYILHVSGRSKKPKFHFSFVRYNFGACLLYRDAVVTEPGSSRTGGARVSRSIDRVSTLLSRTVDRKKRRAVLTVTNHDDSEVTFDIFYNVSPHIEVTAPTTFLKRGESTTVNIAFMPREVGHYEEIITFDINHLYKVHVTVIGEGVLPQVELVNLTDQLIRLDAVPVGSSVRKVVPIRNPGKIPLAVSFDEDTHTQLAKKFIAIAPKDTTVVKPGEMMDLIMLFNPRVRVPSFSEELVARVEDSNITLLRIEGSSQGIEVKLDTTDLDFGRVVPGTQVTKRIVMENIGDRGTKYKWNAKAFAPYFSIRPVSGYIPVNGEVSFGITFHTENITSWRDAESIKVENLQCKIEDADPLNLTITASCIDRPAPMENVMFRCSVRESVTKSVKVHNPTDGNWALKPTIDNDVWSGMEILSVPAKSDAEYIITYKPLKMTTVGDKNAPDRGTLFFPLPNGQAYLFNLVGEAAEPKSSGTITREIYAKQTHTELIMVKNWLPKTQRFHAVLDFGDLKVADKLYGPPYIDVPGLSSREFKFTFLTFIGPANYTGTVKFINKQSGEYIFYDVAFDVHAPQVIQIIELESPVRQSVSHVVDVENPLDEPVEYRVKCSSDDIIVPKSIALKPNSEARLELTYFPLVAQSKSTTHILQLESDALGLYSYELMLRSLAASVERNVSFKVAIGSSQTQTVRFVSHSPNPTDYTFKLSPNSSFSVLADKGIIKAPAASYVLDGVEVAFDVTFEPSSLGNSSETLVLSHPTAGEYSFVLSGHCVVPKPQGPIEIAPGGSTKIPFKNAFTKKTDFQIALDDPTNFQVNVKGSVLSLPPKGKSDIVVHFKPTQASSVPVYTKLTLQSNTDPACSWTYYLEGRK